MTPAIQQIVDLFVEQQRTVNTYVETHLVRAAEARFGRETSCGACTETSKHCCRMLVVIPLLDAVPIAARVRSLGDPELVARLRTAAEAQKSLTATEWWQTQTPCPFLVDERCAIYAVRPLPCRAHLAWSPPRHCSGYVVEKLVTTEPSLEANLYVIAQERKLLAAVFDRTPKLPYVDTLPAAVLYGLDAIESQTVHRFMRKLLEAETDVALMERRAEDVRRVKDAKE